ncbi:MAG TPA: hypothetical protein PLO78_06200 [Candidatus Omnitrophota bacterium]|nr:hypothetical protein [Candidatus Omnitrophota bacterium]
MKEDQKIEAIRRSNQRKVRNILIHRPMQREFSFMLIALFMVSSAAIAWVIHQTIRDAAFGGGFYFGKVNPFQILSDVSYQIIIRVTLVLIFTLILIGSYGITFLHRAAGPVFRFRQTLLKINRGELPSEITLREGDFFHEVAQDINVIIKRLKLTHEKMTELKTKLNDAHHLATSDELRRKIENMQAMLDSFSKEAI